MRANGSGDSNVADEASSEKILADFVFDATGSGFGGDWTMQLRILHTDRDWCFLLYDAVQEQVERTSRKPLRILRSTTFVDFFIATLLATLSLTAYLFLSGKFNFALPDISKFTLDQKIDLLLAIIARQSAVTLPVSLSLIAPFFVLLGVVLFRPATVCNKIMNRSVFYWSDAIAVEDRTRALVQNLTWVVFGGLIVAIVGGLIVEAFVRHWT